MNFFLRLVYKLVPNILKKYTYLALKKIYIPKSEYYQHLHFRGFFKENFIGKSFYIYSLPTIIENTIFWKGIEQGYEPMTLKCWYFICRNSEQIFDIGSNTGIFILISHAANKKSNIHSFDPSKKFIYAQKKIKQKNNINLNINNYALGDVEGEISFDGYQVHKDNNKMENGKKMVKIKKLSNYIKNNNINITEDDSIKIDVEHFEYYVLKDIIETIREKIPNIIIEIATDREAELIKNLIQDIDYTIYLIDDKKQKILKTNNIKKSLYRNVLLLNKKYEYEFNENFKKFLN
tara:strand:- start:127 stop:1002 length:876 start_codon:yes stop_codon:yes gene_type:complete